MAKIIKDGSNPWDERSRTNQDKYNKQINKNAALFYCNSLVPKLNEELSVKLGNGEWVSIDVDDEMVINFEYPQIFETKYIIPHIRLEIGPLAEWMPSHNTSIVPFVAEYYEWLFEQKSTDILTIDVERTFWEKITILHKIANFPQGKPLPYRYARHLYDVYCLGNSEIKSLAFEKKELLEKDVTFKKKFYYSKNAHYEMATLQTVKLIPSEGILQQIKNDYLAMANMFYGNIPEFEAIVEFLKELEKEIHEL